MFRATLSDFTLRLPTVGSFEGTLRRKRCYSLAVERNSRNNETPVLEGLDANRALPNDILQKPVARNGIQEVARSIRVSSTSNQALRHVTFLGSLATVPILCPGPVYGLAR
jgi:hypothetical protein